MQVSKLRDFNYTNDRLIVADMDHRDKSYIFTMQNKINELVEELNSVNTKLINLIKRVDSNKLKEEKEEADAASSDEHESAPQKDKTVVHQQK